MMPVTWRTRTTTWLFVVIIAIGLIILPTTLLTHLVGETPLWINLTESAPRGIYVVIDPHSLTYGSYVLFSLPDATHELIATWGWQPDVLVLKQAAALPGDVVCVNGITVFIQGKKIGTQLTHDRRGRALPRIQRCHSIHDGEFFPLSTHSERSFDGRYFGVLQHSEIHAVLRPLWLLPEDSSWLR